MICMEQVRSLCKRVFRFVHFICILTIFYFNKKSEGREGGQGERREKARKRKDDHIPGF